MRMRKLLLPALLALAPVGASAWSHGNVKWRENHDQALAEAAAAKKPVFIEFYSDT